MNAEIINKYNIETVLKNVDKHIVLTDCMDTIIKRNTDLDGILKSWSSKMAKEFGIYKKYLLFYRREVVASKMHNTVPIQIIYKELFDQCAYFGLIEKEKKEFFCKYALDTEVNCEILSHTPIIKTLDFLREQKANGCKIYCVSDFRLSGEEIRKFFVNIHEESLFDGIFSSCDYGLTKKQGDFYKYVLEVLDQSSDNCLMIGDNIMSDCINAGMNGIKSCWIH